MKENFPKCAQCPFKNYERLCQVQDGKSFSCCPTLNKQTIISEALNEYQNPDVSEFAKQATLQTIAAYKISESKKIEPIKTRITETIEFANRMKYRRLGLAFCIGLSKEATIIEKLLSSHGFEVVSAICKMGRVAKKTIGVPDLPEQFSKIMCNPIAQAMVLNEENTEFNLVVGLCVGHDSLFFKYANAPCTVLAVKDRLLGNNPLAAIYTIDSFYTHLK